MTRKAPATPTAAPSPPPSLSLEELSAWHDEFNYLKPGALESSDVPLMVELVRAKVELDHAYRRMIAKDRGRDVTAHWRGVVGIVTTLRTKLRLTTSARVRNDKVIPSDNNYRGHVATGVTADKAAGYEPGKPFTGWRDMFPEDNATVVPIKRKKKT